MKPIQNSLEIVPVENGLVVFVNRRGFDSCGIQVPRFVFTDAEKLASSIATLLVHGTVGEPVFTGTGLPGDPIKSTKPIGELISEHQPCKSS